MTLTMTNSLAKPRQQPGIFIQELDDELALCSADSSEIHFLNTAAKVVWDLCDGQHTVDDMERVMRATFDLEEGQNILGDINAAVKSLQEKNLIVV